MPTREQMQGLVQEILDAYEDRSAGLAQLKPAVKTQLKELDSAHSAMSAQLRSELASGEEERLRDARALKQDLVRGVADLRRDVGGLRDDLAKGVAERAAAVGTELRNLGHARSAMSQELKATLARDVSGLLRDFDQAHTAMSKELRAELANGTATLRRDGREMKSGLARGVADRKRDVGGLLGGFDAELTGARDEWQKLATTMQGKRGVLLAAVKAPEAPMPPPVEEVAEAEAVARAEPIEMTPETAGLRERVFEYLANRPDGTRMTGLEEEFALSRIQMARILKSLMDDNKVEKRDLLYFAI